MGPRFNWGPGIWAGRITHCCPHIFSDQSQAWERQRSQQAPHASVHNKPVIGQIEWRIFPLWNPQEAWQHWAIANTHLILGSEFLYYTKISEYFSVLKKNDPNKKKHNPKFLSIFLLRSVSFFDFSEEEKPWKKVQNIGSLRFPVITHWF